jgi:hypothetical protein
MYELGVGVAVLMWAMGQITALLLSSKIYRENLKLVGLAPSVVDGKPVEVDAKYFDRPLYIRLLIQLFFSIIGLATTLLSWIYVVLAVAMVVRHVIRDLGVPSEIAQFRWRLKNQLMSRDQILSGFMITNGVDPSRFLEYRDSYIAGMEFRGYEINRDESGVI